MAVVLHGTNGLTFNDDSVQDKAAQTVGAAPGYAVRMWVTYNAISAPTVLASGNVSSITDVNVGRHNPAFTAAMPDAKYSVAAGHTSGGTGATAVVTRVGALADKTSSGVGLNSSSTSAAANSFSDGDEVYAQVFR